MKKFDLSVLPEAPDLEMENAFWSLGVQWVAGIDEAGRGALAGPVAAAVLVLPKDVGLMQRLHGVRDSKQMTPTKREYWAERLRWVAVAYAIGFASNQEIDELGIVPATQRAVFRALEGLPIFPGQLLMDYMAPLDSQIPQTILVKGDARSLSIAGASILAKTARDSLMRDLDLEYPAYGFAAHKGYCTLAHRKALRDFGYCPFHRKSFQVKFRGL